MGLTDYTISDKKYFQAGVEYERERIIKLLEESECQGEDDWCGIIKQAIALIKGEQK